MFVFALPAVFACYSPAVVVIVSAGPGWLALSGFPNKPPRPERSLTNPFVPFAVPAYLHLYNPVVAIITAGPGWLALWSIPLIRRVRSDPLLIPRVLIQLSAALLFV